MSFCISKCLAVCKQLLQRLLKNSLNGSSTRSNLTYQTLQIKHAKVNKAKSFSSLCYNIKLKLELVLVALKIP